MDKAIFLIILGMLLSLAPNRIIGFLLIVIGTYLMNKHINDAEKGISDTISAKKEEINNLDAIFTKKEKEKQEELDNKLKDKKDKLENIDQHLDQLEQERITRVDKNLKDTKNELLREKDKLRKIKKELLIANEDLELQEYGLYEPKYNFINATAYKERLNAVRKQQKQMIKDKTAAIGSSKWTVNDSKRQGEAFINVNIKQILRSFNNETEVIITKVKHSNLENSKKRIQKSFDVLNNLYKRENVSITQGYLNLKFDEMHLAYEYAVKKEEEKELLREAREREREERKLQKELEKEKKKFDKQNTKINKEIEEVKEQLTKAAEDEKAKLEAEIKKLQEALNKNNEEVRKINEWQEKPGAGYVYIISNIGSFGENVFKIGVTRREHPEDRIRELSSASVPFRYDTHVFIFSKNAYELESTLHKRFDKQRVNKVNMRKEFFHITIDDVKQIVEENKGQVHSFVEHPDAEEYYDTLKIEKRMDLLK